MFGLETDIFVLLIFCLAAACLFIFVNGFHDTANAVATVIYTNTLRPWAAVVWSAFWNFIGVFAGGIGVAMGIVYLLPMETLINQSFWHGLAMVGALLLSAIIWNLGTWYYGLPSSSSHTLIGSILGLGIVFSFLPSNQEDTFPWIEATKIGLSLVLSPVLGFTLTIFLMFVLKRFVKKKAIFREPHKLKPPPLWIRSILIVTCTMVSFFHGSNDGQKGVGLVMLILIALAPSYYALDHSQNLQQMQVSIAKVEKTLNKINTRLSSASDIDQFRLLQEKVDHIQSIFASSTKLQQLPDNARFLLRRDILLITNRVSSLLEGKSLGPADRALLHEGLIGMRSFTDYAPDWVMMMVALSLGIGTMVGWRRIVKTIGEKIGNEHLTYAQGASAEFMAASVVGFSTLFFKLPVSTTHILSSGVAGSMVANKGIKNLNSQTVKYIAMAWVLTLPVTMLLSGSLFLIFRWCLT